MTVWWVRDLSADVGAFVSPVKMRPAASEHQVGPCVPTINQDQGLIQRPAVLQRSGGRAKNMRENFFFFEWRRWGAKKTSSGAKECCDHGC